jgi:hypothetical protein
MLSPKNNLLFPVFLGGKENNLPIPMAARSKAWVCDRSLVGIVGSNPTVGMNICMLCVSCIVR